MQKPPLQKFPFIEGLICAEPLRTLHTLSHFILVSSCCYSKYQRLFGLNRKHLFLAVLEARISKIRVLADLTSFEDLLPILWMTALLLHPHLVERKRGSKPPFLSRYKAANHKGSIPMTYLLPKGPHLQILSP